MSRKASKSIDLGKRAFLGSAGAAAVGMTMPLWRRAEAATKAQYDAIVVGAGTAGMMIGIFAAKSKARVLFIEKAPTFGGTLPLSGGEIAAAGTVFQKQQGIADSPDQHYADNMRISENTANPALTRLWVDNGAAMTDWLASQGYKLNPGNPRAETGHHPFSVARYHGSGGGGKGIFQVVGPIFDEAVKSGKGISLQLNTGVVDLVQDPSGKVLGVIAESADGTRSEIFARNVILASGGCVANPRLFSDLNNVPHYGTSGSPYSMGTGIMLGVAAGGHVWGQNFYVPSYGSIMSDDLIPTSTMGGIANNPTTRPPWELHVNYEGNRFVKEDEADNGIREAALRDQKGHRYWVVYDQEAVDKAPPLVPRMDAAKLKEAFKTHPSFAMGQSVRELGIKAGINPANLVKTVAAYNDALKRGAPDPMGRSARPAPIARGPFYAIRLQGNSPVSTAGLAIDGNLRVITSTGAPIPNLYAVGEVTGMGATAGKSFVGGSMLTPALTFGKLLGERIVKLSA